MATKIVHSISDGTSTLVEMTPEEQIQYDADQAAALLEEQQRQQAQAIIDKAVSFLTGRDYKAAYDNVGASVNIPAELKTYLQEIIKNQAAVATALNQIDILIDMDNLV